MAISDPTRLSLFRSRKFIVALSSALSLFQIQGLFAQEVQKPSSPAQRPPVVDAAGATLVEPGAKIPPAANSVEDAPSLAIVIPEDPRVIDSVSLVPEIFAKKATVRFSDNSLEEVAAWIQEQIHAPVVLDDRADFRSLDSVSEELQDTPLYLLLDRLKSNGVAWDYTEGVLYFSQPGSRFTTIQYNVGDLLDKNFTSSRLKSTIDSTIDPDSWESVGGNAGLVMIGDVLFIRQTSKNHRRVAGLLAALRNHGRRTLVDDSMSHEGIRKAMNEKFTIQFRNKPLAGALDELAKTAKVELRIDHRSLKEAGVSERTPVSIDIREQNLIVILEVFVKQHHLDWQLQDGALWIYSPEVVDSDDLLKTAVFDIRDLCRDFKESEALNSAIQQQADPDGWNSNGGSGAIKFPIPGAMVVRNQEKVLDEVLRLLENYRVALRGSKARVSPETDPNAVLTRYYRVPSQVAEDLERALPNLLRPESWRNVEHPKAPGTIHVIRSWSGKMIEEGKAVEVPYSVLVIEQTRAIHEELPKLLHRIQHGDNVPDQALPNASQGMGGGGMGGNRTGGAFGGGMF